MLAKLLSAPRKILFIPEYFIAINESGQAFCPNQEPNSDSYQPFYSQHYLFNLEKSIVESEGHVWDPNMSWTSKDLTPGSYGFVNWETIFSPDLKKAVVYTTQARSASTTQYYIDEKKNFMHLLI